MPQNLLKKSKHERGRALPVSSVTALERNLMQTGDSAPCLVLLLIILRTLSLFQQVLDPLRPVSISMNKETLYKVLPVFQVFQFSEMSLFNKAKTKTLA